MIIDDAAPDTLIPKTAPAIAAVVPLLLKLPIMLFCIRIVPVEEELIPTIAPCVVVGIATNAPVPDEAPIVLGVTFPIFTFPAVILTPHKTPLAVAALLEVARLMAVIILPCND